jgi:hypothetical protein
MKSYSIRGIIRGVIRLSVKKILFEQSKTDITSLMNNIPLAVKYYSS